MLDLLDAQREKGAGWSAWGRLEQTCAHLDLLIKTNFQNFEERPPQEHPVWLATILKQQSPVVGMSGSVNKTLVQQFRMPGYPLVLITTDVLQEGEDLHTFCCRQVHYGISWTPIAMEQKIGRIDRIGSMAQRRLAHGPSEVLDIHFPYLRDTVEVYQMQRVFERMNAFVESLHTFKPIDSGSKYLHLDQALNQDVRIPSAILGRLSSPFEVKPGHLMGPSFLTPRQEPDVCGAFEALMGELGLGENAGRWVHEGGSSAAPVHFHIQGCLDGREHLVICRRTIGDLRPGAAWFRWEDGTWEPPFSTRLLRVRSTKGVLRSLACEGYVLFDPKCTGSEDLSTLSRRVIGESLIWKEWLQGDGPAVDLQGPQNSLWGDVVDQHFQGNEPAPKLVRWMKSFDVGDWVPSACRVNGRGARIVARFPFCRRELVLEPWNDLIRLRSLAWTFPSRLALGEPLREALEREMFGRLERSDFLDFRIEQEGHRRHLFVQAFLPMKALSARALAYSIASVMKEAARIATMRE